MSNIKELEEQLERAKTFSQFIDNSELIAEIEEQIAEAKKQQSFLYNTKIEEVAKEDIKPMVKEAKEVAEVKEAKEKVKQKPKTKAKEELSEGEYEVFLPTHKDIRTTTTSKEYKFLGELMKVSNFNDINERNGIDMEAYIYENVLNGRLEELKKEGVKVPSKNTIKKYMNKFEKITIDGESFHFMDIKNTPNGLVYMFKQSYDGKYFVKIPSRQLTDLLVNTNDNILKLYCILLYTCNIQEFTTVNRTHLSTSMGWKDSRGNDNTLSIALSGLERLGFIHIKHEWIKEKVGDKIEMKQIICIKLATYQEWYNVRYKKNR